MLQSEQSDILHKTYPLHILLEFDLGILRKSSECIKKEDKITIIIIISTVSVKQIRLCCKFSLLIIILID